VQAALVGVGHKRNLPFLFSIIFQILFLKIVLYRFSVKVIQKTFIKYFQDKRFPKHTLTTFFIFSNIYLDKGKVKTEKGLPKLRKIGGVSQKGAPNKPLNS
jgi:hypothetical protein